MRANGVPRLEPRPENFMPRLQTGYPVRAYTVGDQVYNLLVLLIHSFFFFDLLLQLVSKH